MAWNVRRKMLCRGIETAPIFLSMIPMPLTAASQLWVMCDSGRPLGISMLLTPWSQILSGEALVQ